MGLVSSRKSNILRYELRIVMFGPRQKVLLTPLKEATEGDLRVSVDLYLISVWPDIQADEHHTNAHRAIELKQSSAVSKIS